MTVRDRARPLAPALRGEGRGEGISFPTSSIIAHGHLERRVRTAERQTFVPFVIGATVLATIVVIRFLPSQQPQTYIQMSAPVL